MTSPMEQHGTYKILRVIGSNFVCSQDSTGQEIILRGLGIGFKKSAGDLLPAARVEKVYALRDPGQCDRLMQLMQDVPSEYLDISTHIIETAERVLGRRLSENVYITLTDHISFAVEKGDGNYYILGPDGTILGVRGDTANRSDGAENILVTGLSATGNRGEILTGDECIRPLIDFCAEADSRLNGLRSNLVSVEVMKPTSSSADISLCLVLREGVKAYVRNPLNLTQEKAKAFADFYLSLDTDERLGGSIEVTDDALNPGQVRVFYSANG